MNEGELGELGRPLADAFRNFHSDYVQPLRLRKRELRFDRTLVMGILNVTPDSFSDGGKYAEPDRAFEACDVVAGPVAPTVAFRLGEKLADPLQMYLADVFTITCNLAALPGLSVPCGLESESGMPVGLQLLGRPFDEATLLRVALAYEQATPWVRMHPEI